MKHSKEFKVAAKSSNTNSFGLYQMILVSKDGDAYKSHASMYNAKEVGSVIKQTIVFNEDNVVKHEYFIGHELTTKLPRPDRDTIKEIWK